MSKLKIREGWIAARRWASANPQRAARVIAMTPVTLFAFTVAAGHTLETGRERAHVTGWAAWSVAGSLEILTAYAFFLFLRNRGWKKVFPFLVFAAFVGMILWVNLATIDDYSIDAVTLNPFPAIYAVLPAFVFVVGVVLMEVDAWKAPTRPPGVRQTKKKTGDTQKDQKPPTTREKPADDVEGPVDRVTLERGRRAVAALRERGINPTGDTLRIEMKVRKGTALAILKIINDEERQTA